MLEIELDLTQITQNFAFEYKFSYVKLCTQILTELTYWFQVNNTFLTDFIVPLSICYL